MGKKLLIWTVKDLKEVIEQMTKKETKFDCIIFIEGNRGLGKSTLGNKLLIGLNIEQPYSMRRDLVYSREETLKHLANKINGAILSDEMINVAYKRDFYNEDQKELLKAFDMYRDSRNVFIGCIPKFADLDTKIQKLCKIRLTVVRRGVALIHMQNPTIYSTDPWDIKNNAKIESKWALQGKKNPRYSQLTTVVGILHFGDLTPNQREDYDSIKAEKRNHVFAKYGDESLIHDPDKLFLSKMIDEMKAGKLTPETFNMMCNVSSKNAETIRRKINAQLKDEGDEFRWKDYCMTAKQKERKDHLGFSLPEIETPTVDDKPLEETIKVAKTEEKPPSMSNQINDDPSEDIFGFSDS